MDDDIKNYYDNLATEYDSDRFGNSYGKYIDNQEKIVLRKWLSNQKNQKVLDVGCGTGRFLDFANYGVDISPKMIEIAQQKFPKKKISRG